MQDASDTINHQSIFWCSTSSEIIIITLWMWAACQGHMLIIRLVISQWLSVIGESDQLQTCRAKAPLQVCNWSLSAISDSYQVITVINSWNFGYFDWITGFFWISKDISYLLILIRTLIINQCEMLSILDAMCSTVVETLLSSTFPLSTFLTKSR